MSTSDHTPGGQPGPPAGRPWRGGATERPPWEKDADADTTQRIPPVQDTPAGQQNTGARPQSAAPGQPGTGQQSPATEQQGMAPGQQQPPPGQQPATPPNATSGRPGPSAPGPVVPPGPAAPPHRGAVPPPSQQPTVRHAPSQQPTVKHPVRPGAFASPQHEQPPPRLPSSPGKSNELVGRVPHGDSAARRIGRAVVRAFSSTKQPRELEEILTAVQAPITTGRRIAVTSVRGGAGKTAVAAMLGSVFAGRRAEPVLAVDADPDAGSLAWRLGVESAMTLPGLAPALQTASGQDLSSVDRLLPRTSRGLWVVPGGGAAQPQLARDVTRALSRLFAVAVLDCATGMNNPAAGAVLSDAHAVVVVAPASPDGVRTTAEALTRIGPAALQHVVVALNAVDRTGAAALRTEQALSLFSQLGLPAVVLPHDRHAGAGGPIDPGRLAEPTVTEVSRLAAWSLRRARPL
ncbi:MinD/ParA family ATP-binding protein [Saccharopolyspora erythraea]|uniref:MinD/ParA family ATP-binding protein n=1 Tax=Saccharopolyspora erythraea TaxID=1836 RepID=UPI002011F3F7|nr:hypothetical protein [Saccharopolyspora erythraea]